MPEVVKVAVIYRDSPPRLFDDPAPDTSLWCVEFVDERQVLGSLVPTRQGYTAVFFPADPEAGDCADRIAQVFPGSEMIGFESGPAVSPGAVEGRLRLPQPYSLLSRLVGGLARNRQLRGELIQVRRRAAEMRELLDVFVDLVDTAWDVGERKRGITRLMERVLATVRARSCVVYQLQSDSSLQRTYGAGDLDRIERFEDEANLPIIQKVVSSGVPFCANGFLYPGEQPHMAHGFSVSSVLCFPLQRDQETLGVIEFLNKEDRTGFTDEDREVVQMMIGPLSVALRNLEKFGSSERLAIIDELTQLFNYRFVMQFLVSEVQRCLRYRKKVSLLFIDVDGFKRINDSFGHLVGSQALSEIGRVFKEAVRTTDVVGRYGGDEFVIVLPETPLEGAMVIAERIRTAVEAYQFVAQDLGIRLTVSLGVACFPKHTLTAEGLIKKADAAMYSAKEISKNTIKVAV